MEFEDIEEEEELPVDIDDPYRGMTPAEKKKKIDDETEVEYQRLKKEQKDEEARREA